MAREGPRTTPIPDGPLQKEPERCPAWAFSCCDLPAGRVGKNRQTRRVRGHGSTGGHHGSSIHRARVCFSCLVRHRTSQRRTAPVFHPYLQSVPAGTTLHARPRPSLPRQAGGTAACGVIGGPGKLTRIISDRIPRIKVMLDSMTVVSAARGKLRVREASASQPS
jgi:hypothetical protein